jgi:hypothetical protein
MFFFLPTTPIRNFKQGCQIFLAATYQNGGKYIYHMTIKYKMTMAKNELIGLKIGQMSIEYTSIFHCKTLHRKFTQIGIFGLKIYHLATLTSRRDARKTETLTPKTF